MKGKIRSCVFAAAVIVILGCGGKPMINNTGEPGTIGSIDIKAGGFFKSLQSWNDDSLVTFDGWGRFSEISFQGESGVRIKPLIQFPKVQTDGLLYAWPDAGLITAESGKMLHVADVTTGKTKSFIPLLSWNHLSVPPVLLDGDEGILYLRYFSQIDYSSTYIYYNYKNDKIVDQNGDGGDTNYFYRFLYPVNNSVVLGESEYEQKDVQKYTFSLYNWRTKEFIQNDLTKKITNLHPEILIIDREHSLNLKKNVLIASDSYAFKTRLKLDFNEDFTDVTITPLNYLYSKEKFLTDFCFSKDGGWAEALMCGFRGFDDDLLYKEAFFHFDDRYPNGISMVVLGQDYVDFDVDYGAFVEHPVHGMCYAIEHHEEENGNDQLYLRLYKMDAILTEINRQLLETANEAANSSGSDSG